MRMEISFRLFRAGLTSPLNSQYFRMKVVILYGLSYRLSLKLICPYCHLYHMTQIELMPIAALMPIGV